MFGSCGCRVVQKSFALYLCDSIRFLPHMAAIFRWTTCATRQIGIITGSDGGGMKAWGREGWVVITAFRIFSVFAVLQSQCQRRVMCPSETTVSHWRRLKRRRKALTLNIVSFGWHRAPIVVEQRPYPLLCVCTCVCVCVCIVWRFKGLFNLISVCTLLKMKDSEFVLASAGPSPVIF